MKNIVTNLLGLIFWGFAVYEMTHEASIKHILFYVIIGGALFLFKGNDTISYIKGFLNKFIVK